MSKGKSIVAKKKFGQNFLNDKNIIKKTIEVISPLGKKIIEIGPGLGALTEELNKKANKLIAFEIDEDMINHLLKNNILSENQIIKGDFLDADLSDFNGFEIVGNIPYYITSEIIFKIIENRNNFKRATLMVQNEVADRLVAKINTPDYSKLSITVQYVADVKKELFVKKTLFSPSPKVDSAIVTLEFKDENNSKFNKLKDFFKLCFLSRRKKLSWSLKTKYSDEKIKQAYKNLNLGEFTRIQELDLFKIEKLYDQLESE
ncbi:16S rRNA (adenine(1518)-N(6)/adenine(1519)-N(6))-dimethyltransferase RsmA [Mycoplasma zalophidermidis]|uniref:Ribosomal RNA small subunit methyltransferase A n=1 Tax=Mycoplasma zalophidermidis TaxID=398174 RepID=A0ABS6DRN0_9MOLU|nr:16S rRNA (adenine(1518)-N(6)/adenine(1519)-N(6))-dimethyltransferase RsmA [Mycoplasma zalophidermidis]MBU4689886.1 16S rRNA (adenine(1518)-N(6)/adenine(1519)-N(6))-dimethyltransferase RsmA [Mycoplasma zalophidermidis]MBU4693672.1 16S rRNA (adenine(1518)-N(6)/adenine(1519)-N(6))-dimethyltransferase RsmA [Mycoplasma zalophidermidis]MCR8966756.1 16S rRNA (adenine(1518)-N(6)/adenine(1519)-N(6))-dimethyltransferase RsmA [Mycoplasma zalophidermidis]